jgi:hypothetical protein
MTGINYRTTSPPSTVRLHGANPLHRIRKNAKGSMGYRINYNKLVFFAKQFPKSDLPN